MSIYNIQNTKELRDAYIFLGFEKELGEPYGSIAKKIRAAIREWNNRPEPMEKVVQQDDYGYITTLIEFPEFVETAEDAEEYFDYKYRRTYVPTYYDCTGQIFTTSHKCFKRRGKWMCRHSMAIDC